MKKSLALTLFTILFYVFSGGAQDELLLIRSPALNPDGSQLAFSYQGDIWTVAASGGTAHRLTIHESYEGRPAWSPDGKQIAFQGERYGNSDIFVMDAEGSLPKQLTFFSGADLYPQWKDNETIIFNTRRYFAQVEREWEVQQVKSSGGTPFRILESLGNNPAVSPDGRYIAFELGSCRFVREAYLGPANRDIWLYDTQAGTFTQLTTDEGQDAYPDWGANNVLYFLSARSGRYNIYSLGIENGSAAGPPEMITGYQDEGIRHFDVSADGQKISFEYATGIYLMDAAAGADPQQVTIRVARDYRFDPVEVKTLTDQVSDYALSPDGKFQALVLRGEIFVKPNDKDKKRSSVITNHPFRDQDVQWLSDSTLLFLSDRDGARDIFFARSADPKEGDLTQTFKLEIKPVTRTPEEENDLLVSPDRKKLVYRRGRGQMIVADIDPSGRLSNEKILHDSWSTPEDISWSPDSRWLAYSLDDLDFNSEIYIHPADNSTEPVNVSLHPRPDASPVWSADGSKLGFLSDRNNGDTDVWFVWLKKSDWEKTQRDWEDTEEEKDPKADKKKPKEDSTKVEVKPVEIDFDDIYRRLVQVTGLPGNESDLAISKDGNTFYFTTNRPGRQGGAGEPDLLSIKWDGKEQKTLLEKKNIRNVQWDPAGKELYFLTENGQMGKFNLENKKEEKLPFEARMTINHPEERRQVFEEAWRALDAGFYDPEFHGRDWTRLRDHYRQRAILASTSQDFRDMFNEMLGQLNASHMGMTGPDPEETQRNRSGLLGVEVEPVENGLKIKKVLADGPAGRETSKLAVGEIITAVNGSPIAPATNLFQLLLGTANERTLLTIADAYGKTREVVIRPATSLSDELYNDWVEGRKKLTETYSSGRLGYIHVQGMNWQSFERFERELTASGQGKEGIVIDVRYNGGGWTTDMLMTTLNVRQHSYTIPRGAAAGLDKEHLNFTEHYPYGERLPFPALMKPSIALCNQNSYSNAEIFSHAYKTLDIGALVGQPTFGAVISTGSYGLMEGSRVRMPYRAWYVKATKENMEHGPAVPDVIVAEAPDSKAKDEDPQLRKAVELLLEQMEGEGR